MLKESTSIRDPLGKFLGKWFYQTGLYKLLIRSGSLGNFFLIVHYHKVKKAKNNHSTLPACDELVNCSINQADFISQMQFLKEHFYPISLKEAILSLLKGLSIPPNSVVVSFDDGFKEVFLNAFPILKTYGIPATIFCPGQIFIKNGVRRGMLWDHTLFYILDNTQCKEFEINEKKYSLITEGEKRRTVVSILNGLREQPYTLKESFLALLAKELNVTIAEDAYGQLYLSSEDILFMKEHGMNFGVHSMTHPYLSSVNGKELEVEVREAKKVVEEIAGETCPYFAWPYGESASYNDAALKMVKESGYICARSTEYGLNGQNTDLYRLKSIRGEVPSLFDLVLRTSIASAMGSCSGG